MVSGNNFKTALKRLDISQAEAAKLLGKSRQTIVTWVGKSELDQDTIELIREKLKIDLANYGQAKSEPIAEKIFEDSVADIETQLREIIKRQRIELELLNNALNDKLTIISLLNDKVRVLEKELIVRGPKTEESTDDDNRTVPTELKTK